MGEGRVDPRFLVRAGMIVLLTGIMVEQACAGQKKTSKSERPVTEQAKKMLGRNDSAPTVSELLREARQKGMGRVPAEHRATGRPSRRQANVSKKILPKAEVRPRTDLMYHGMLEDSRRYDPRPNARMGGVPNPQTPDLTHDHFQELDRNQDGKIDPVERAFSRLDIDRDLHNRQPQ